MFTKGYPVTPKGRVFSRIQCKGRKNKHQKVTLKYIANKEQINMKNVTHFLMNHEGPANIEMHKFLSLFVRNIHKLLSLPNEGCS